jgi:hypothetical protein
LVVGPSMTCGAAPGLAGPPGAAASDKGVPPAASADAAPAGDAPPAAAAGSLLPPGLASALATALASAPAVAAAVVAVGLSVMQLLSYQYSPCAYEQANACALLLCS